MGLTEESAKKSGVECQRRGKSATVPFNRLILRGILRAVRPRAADTGPPTFWRSLYSGSFGERGNKVRLA